MPHTFINAHQLGQQISLTAQQATSTPPAVAHQPPMNLAQSRKAGKLRFVPQQQLLPGLHPTFHSAPVTPRNPALQPSVHAAGPVLHPLPSSNEQWDASSHSTASRARRHVLDVHRRAVGRGARPAAVRPTRSLHLLRRARPGVGSQTRRGRIRASRSRSSLRPQPRHRVRGAHRALFSGAAFQGSVTGHRTGLCLWR